MINAKKRVFFVDKVHTLYYSLIVLVTYYFFEGSDNMKNKANPRIWLKTLRRKKGYTQEEIAEKLGMPKTTYSSYEQGHRTPSVETCKVIADELGVSWTIFFDEEVRET